MTTIELNPSEMTEKDWEAFQNFFDATNDLMEKEIEDIAKELGVSDSCAINISYLRTRSRWSQEKEDHLIELDRAGEPMPDFNDY